jgi:enterochelin esterase-like enzyme
MRISSQCFTLLLALTLFIPNANGQGKVFRLSASISISDEILDKVQSRGRLFLFLSENPEVEPRTRTWPSASSRTHIFAVNLADVKAEQGISIDHQLDWDKTSDWTLEDVPEGEYNVQVLWDQDQLESGINAPGNVYSERQKVIIDRETHLEFVLNQVIAPTELVSHDLVRLVDLKSDTLSGWWGKPMHLKASILLPPSYDENEAKEYPIRYNVAGYGGRYTRINYLVNNTEFMKWWSSKESPEIINVFLDGEGPFGDSYQMDSENSGPYGYALIHELAPYIESIYRGTDSPETRFVDGCSTGGWVSLGLQLFYPDFFNGTFSYSPDPVEFENYQLINIYEDKNAYVNEFNYPRPVMRNTSGEPMLSLKDFIQYENVLGSSGTYLNSGGQFSAHTALYSPKGENGLPMPLFDPKTGVIDPGVAEHWKKYDLKIHAEQNWDVLGPKLQGKIYIWMGDMDHFYLNPATRAFANFLGKTSNPESDAEIVFTPMEGHCSQYSNTAVLKQIKERLDAGSR